MWGQTVVCVCGGGGGGGGGRALRRYLYHLDNNRRAFISSRVSIVFVRRDESSDRYMLVF